MKVRTGSGHEIFLQRLKRINEYSEAISVLETAWKFSRFGFKVNLVPNISGFGKRPDIKLTDGATRDVLFVEVSVHGPSIKTRDAMRTFDIVSRAIPKSSLVCLGTLHKGLSEQHGKELASKVRRLAREANRTQSFRQLVIKDIIDIGMAPASDWKLLVKWARSRRLSIDGFSSPDFPVGDEILRTSQKIEKEQRQLPPNRPGLLVIENNHLFLNLDEGKISPADVMRGLEESVYSHPNLLAVGVYGTMPGRGARRTILRDQHVFLRWNRAGEFVEYCAILHNRFCNMKVTASTISRVDSALRFEIIP